MFKRRPSVGAPPPPTSSSSLSSSLQQQQSQTQFIKTLQQQQQQQQQKEEEKPITLTLNGNVLVYKPGKQWELQSSDLDIAAAEINKITDEKELLLQEIEELHKEIIETNDMKTVALGMAIEERQKNSLLTQELNAYKQELRDSYKIIVELKKIIPR